MQPTDQHWQTRLNNVSERISYLRSSPKWADLTISFPEQKKRIKAHKWMLALSSPVFEAMMFGPLAEGEVLSLPDDPPEAFEWLLDHLYCNQSNLPNMEMAVEVFKLANKYQIPALCRLCSEYMCARVTADNLPLLYNMAYMFEDKTFLARCEKILPSKSTEVLQSKEVMKFSRSALQHLLENKNLKPSSGPALFKCIHTWGKAEVERLAADYSDVEGRLAAGQSVEAAGMAPHSLRQCVESLLPLVDFLSMSVDEFVEHVLPTGIFTSEENMNILQGIKGVPEIVLPSCVRPRALKCIVLVDRTPEQLLFSNISLHGWNESFCNIQISHPIILLQIEAHFRDISPESELYIYSNENTIVGQGILIDTCCIFEKPVQLESGRLFRLVCKNNSADPFSVDPIYGRQPNYGNYFCNEVRRHGRVNRQVNLGFYQNSIPINVNTDGIKITGNAKDVVKKLLIKYSVLKKQVIGTYLL